MASNKTYVNLYKVIEVLERTFWDASDLTGL